MFRSYLLTAFRALSRQKTHMLLNVIGLSIGMAAALLAAFTTRRRRRDMAIHKVFGASRLSIVHRIAREYLVLTLVSMLIAFPALTLKYE